VYILYVPIGITILLAMSVYQIIILDKIPTSSDGIPLIGELCNVSCHFYLHVYRTTCFCVYF